MKSRSTLLSTCRNDLLLKYSGFYGYIFYTMTRG